MKKKLILMLSYTLLITNPLLANADTLKVCAAKNELPYSHQDKKGFENLIAEAVADSMDRQVEYVWSDRPAIFLVSDYLEKGKCDVVMGVDKDDQRVLTSRPYYRSSYVFVYRADKGVSIDSWESPDIQKLDKFAFTPSSPAEAMLRKIGKYEQNFNYLMSLINFKSRRNSYVRYHPEQLVQEVVQGNADIAVLWGPEAARYVNQSSVPLVMKVANNEFAVDGMGTEVGQYYSQSLAVKEGNEALLNELNEALEDSREKIIKILKEEGVPLVEEDKLAGL